LARPGLRDEPQETAFFLEHDHALGAFGQAE